MQTNLYTSGGEYQLSDGRDYVGDYHIHPILGAMVGATHSQFQGRPHPQLFPIGNTSTTGTTVLGGAILNRTPGAGSVVPITVPSFTPSLNDLKEYEKYIVSGSTYKSNISQVNTRDQKGNIQLNESASNSLLIFEPVSNNFTNRSIVASIDTQFQFFKFPAQISTTVQDLEFDESLLDIDVQQGILNDPYQGKLIRNKENKSAGLFFVQGLVKRKFNIKADSIWALKNNLPPFANINDDIEGLDAGENNGFTTNAAGDFIGYYGVTIQDVNPGIFNGYTVGEDAFSEGNTYGKMTVELTTDNTAFTSTIPNSFISILGPNYGRTEWTGISGNSFDDDRFRLTEFDINELPGSYIGILSNIPDTADTVNVNQNLDDPTNGPLQRTLISNQFGFDIEDGGSYYSYVEQKFRDWVLYNYGSSGGSTSDPNINIEKHGDGNKRPTYYLQSYTSTDVNGNFTDWGLNSNNYWTVEDGQLLSGVDKTQWYKLSLPLVGLGFKMFFNDELITGRLRDAETNIMEGQGSSTVGGYPFVSYRIPFSNPSTDPNANDGWILNFDDLNDVLPNGFQPNTNNNIRLECGVGGSSKKLNIYFIGLAKNNNGGSFTSADRSKIVVVPNSITFADPKTENSNNAAATSVNRLRNADFGNGGSTQKNWTIGEKIHF